MRFLGGKRRAGDGASRRVDRRARRAGRGGVRGAALVDDAIDTAVRIVGDVECAIRTDGNSGRTMRGLAWLLHGAREAIGEHLTAPGCLAALELLERDVVSTLWIGRAVPGAVKSDERAVVIAGRKTRAGINHHVVR